MACRESGVPNCADPVFPWLDGQVVLLVGSERPETLVVQL